MLGGVWVAGATQAVPGQRIGLPVRPPDQAVDYNPRIGNQRVSDVQGKRILVVDDDPLVLRMVEHTLSKRGAQICTAADGMEGLAQFYVNRPDLIIVDVMMPGIDGWGICARLRKLSDVPILMLSALGADTHIVRGLRSGADDYVSKPFSDEVLVARVEALLRRPRMSPSPAR